MADRYWVGGTASWDGTAGSKWALTSGGAGGQAVPTSADDVFFSNLSTGTCTIAAVTTVARSINCTGFTGTLTGTAAITVSGSVTLVAGMTYSYTGTMTLAGTGTITSAGKTFGAVTVNGAGITVTLGSSLSQGATSTNTFTLTQGTLALAGFTLTCGIFSSNNTNTRAISFGAGGITLTHNTGATTVLSMNTMTGFSWTGSTGNEGFSYTRTDGLGAATLNAGSVAGGTVSNAINLTLRGGGSSTPGVTVTTGSYVKNLTFPASFPNLSVNSAAYNACGNLTLNGGLGTASNIVPTFLASGTITSAGRTIGNTNVIGSGITLTLADAMTLGAANTFTLTAGTLNLNGFTLSTGIFSSSNSNTRAITFGSANIALTSTTAVTTVLSMATATGFTFTGTGGFTRDQAATATMVFGTTGGTTSNAPNLTVNTGSSALTITTNSWFKNLVFTGSTSAVGTSAVNIAGNLTLASGGTYTSFTPAFRASGTVTSAGKTIGNVTINAASNTVTLADAMTLDTTGAFTLTAGTINLANFSLSTGRFSSNNSNTRAISFGSGNIALTSTSAGTAVLSMLNAIGFTWTGTGGFTRNMAATATMVFGTSGGTTSNAPNLTVNAGSSTLTFSDVSIFKNLDFTGSTCTVAPLFGVLTLNMAGNLTLASGGDYTLVAPTFLASGTITSAGKTLNATTINGFGITVTLADALVCGGALRLSQGTFANPSNFNVTAFNFVSNSGSACTLSLGSSTWTITGGDAVASWVATNASLTFSAGTSTINLTYVGVKEFFAGDRTYYNVNVGGTGDFYIYGTNNFNNITNSVQPATVIFESGLTQTVSNFGLSGTVGNLITISSEAAGFQFTLSKASGTVNAQYLSIQDSIATGGATWNALTSNGNVDAGNNTGWIFGSAATGNMFLMFN
jgi:hypothetical protein